MKGILHITGEHDVGKTIAALGVTHPKKTVIFHDDVKLPGIDREEFGRYLDLVQLNLSLLKMKDYVLEMIEDIEPGRFDSIIFDTWSRFGLALRSWGKDHALEFREKSTMAAGGTYLYGQRWGEGHRYEASVISLLAQKAPTIILVSHLKDHFQGNAATGKQIPDTGKSLNRVCNLRLWLRHNPDSGVPIALVLKRLSTNEISKNGVKVTNILPRRIKPLPDETSIWQSIERYKEVPFGNRLPLPDETPSPFELSILDGILTEDQKEVWRANLTAVESEELSTASPEKAFVREFLAKKENLDASPFELKIALKNAGHDLNMKEVVKLEEGIKNE